MNKILYLSTCNTCQRIINELDLENRDDFEFQDVKEKIISKKELEEISKVSGFFYQELFNKRAQKYTKTDLKEKLIDDENFKEAILKEYTFLKRPIIKFNDEYFIGNSKKVIDEIKEKLQK